VQWLSHKPLQIGVCKQVYNKSVIVKKMGVTNMGEMGRTVIITRKQSRRCAALHCCPGIDFFLPTLVI
jgi:hypothetical protein